MQQLLSNYFLFYPTYPNYDRSFRFDWRYTYESIPIINKIVTIHKQRYDVGRMLGRGAFGEVYIARRLSDRSPVAIKVVSLATARREVAEELQHAFLNEIRMAKRLAKTSKHIVHMYDFDFDQNGWTFIVMELGQQDLEKALQNRSPLSSTERKAMWRQLVSIAVTLDHHQIVHLDIKPSNLVVFPGDVIKLVDLGIADKAQRTRFGRTGTIPYSAPEVTQVSAFHMTLNSTAADIWSWGAVLYRMTYNTSPDHNYTPPCYRPPDHQPSTRDPYLLSILRHTLLLDSKERPDALWLARHPYTKTL